MVTGRTKGMTDRAAGNVVVLAAQRDGPDGVPSEEYLLLRLDENGSLRLTDEAPATAVSGQSKGATLRVTGDVVLAAAQRDDGNGDPTEEYLLLRADQNSQLRTTT